MTATRPRVTAKVAVSLDGCIATATGESQWITGEEARADGRRLRASHDAILVGVGTVLADDPRLTTRTPGEPDPVPVVLDSRLRTPATARVLRGPRRAVILTTSAAPDHRLPADLVRVADRAGRVDPLAALAALAARGVRSVLVEGGAQVHRSFLDAGVVDRLVLYLAPRVIPGGRPWVGGPPVARLADTHRLVVRHISSIGGDVRIILEAEAPPPDGDRRPVT